MLVYHTISKVSKESSLRNSIDLAPLELQLLYLHKLICYLQLEEKIYKISDEHKLIFNTLVTYSNLLTEEGYRNSLDALKTLLRNKSLVDDLAQICDVCIDWESSMNIIV